MGKHPGGVQNPAQRKYGTGASLRGRNVSDQTGVIFKLRIADNKSTSKFVLESSTTYMVSKHAVARILKDTPEAKFIVIARDPIDRIVSHYNWLTSLGLVNLPFEQEIKKHAKEKFNYRFNYKGNFKAYIDFSKYGEQLTRLIDLAGREAVLFWDYKSVFTHWSEYQKELFKFLEIDPTPLSTLQKNKTNSNTRVREILSPTIKQTNTLALKTRIKRLAKQELRKLKGIPVSKSINNPINQPVNRESVEHIVLPYLKKDLEKFKQLDLPTTWKSLHA